MAVLAASVLLAAELARQPASPVATCAVAPSNTEGGPGLPPSVVAVLGRFEGEDPLRPRLGGSGPNGGPSARGFRFWARGVGAAAFSREGASGMAVDPIRRWLWVPDSHNHRVLAFRLDAGGGVGEREAHLVLGQPDFTTTVDDNRARPDVPPPPPEPTPATLYRPTAVAYHARRQWLFVADTGHDRVLVFDLSGPVTDGMPSIASFGDTPSPSTVPTNGEGPVRFAGPTGLAVDPVRDVVWVSDTGHDRLVRISLGGGLESPSVSVVRRPPAAAGFTAPRGLAWSDRGPTLYVADSGNHRVLGLTLVDGHPASDPPVVIGQDTPTARAPNKDRHRSIPDGLRGPWDVEFDPRTGLLFVADARNHRVVAYAVDTAAEVSHEALFGLGVPSLVRPVPDGLPPATRRTMNYPTGVVVSGRQLYVLDRDNNRIVSFDTDVRVTGWPAEDVLGQYHEGRLERPAFDQQGANDGPTSFEFDHSDGVSGVAVSPSGDRLAVADALNGRVLLFDLGPGGLPRDACADGVLGTPDYRTVGGAAIDRRTIRRPQRLAWDATGRHLFVTDDQASRVLRFDVGEGPVFGPPADAVFGQPDFTSWAEGGGPAGLNRPRGVTTDPARDLLFVADTDNHRVVVYDLAEGPEAGRPAAWVLDRVAGGPGASRRLAFPRDPVFDPRSGRLFVADIGNDRIVAYDLAGTVHEGVEAAALELGALVVDPGSPREPLGGLALDIRRRRLHAVGRSGGWIATFHMGNDPEAFLLPAERLLRPPPGTGGFGGSLAVEPTSGVLYTTDGRNVEHQVLGVAFK